MRKTILRRLEALEKDHRLRERPKFSPLEEATVCMWEIVLGYHLDEIRLHESGPFHAYVRAQNYPSSGKYYEAVLRLDTELVGRRHDARRRLFAKVGLDFDRAEPSVLFDAFVAMVNQLPEQWLSWLHSQIRECCGDSEIAPGSNVPRGLSADNFLFF
jgi:hypothetical protein